MPEDLRGIKVTVSDIPFEVATGAPSTPASLTTTQAVRGVVFSWDHATIQKPFYYEYRTKVGAGSWSSWTRSDIGLVVRLLTDTEVSTYGATATIYIEVRTTDGVNTSSTTAGSAAALALSVAEGDLDASAIKPAALHSNTTDRMFDSSARSADDVDDAAATHKFVTANQQTGAGYAYSHLDANGLVASAKIVSTLASTVESNAADGASAQGKLVTDGVHSGSGETIAAQSWTTSTVNSRLSATEKTNLETALDTTLASLAGDTILILGTHGTLLANKGPIKSDLGLDLVENKSGASIMAAELNNTALLATTDALLVDGANDNVLAGINSSTEVTKIQRGSIESVNCDDIVDTGGTVYPFNADGSLASTTVLKDAAKTVTVAQLINSNQGGQSKQLDLSSIASGDLDNIPDGTYSKTTVNQVTGADRAFNALNANNYLITGIEATGVLTVTNMEDRITQYKNIWQDPALTVGGAAKADTERSITGTNGNLIFLKIPVVYDGTSKYWNFAAYIDVGDVNGVLKMDVYDIGEAGKVVAQSTVDLDVGDQEYEVRVDVSGLVGGTRYVIYITLNGTNAVLYKFYYSEIYAECL